MLVVQRSDDTSFAQVEIPPANFAFILESPYLASTYIAENIQMFQIFDVNVWLLKFDRDWLDIMFSYVVQVNMVSSVPMVIHPFMEKHITTPIRTR